MNPTNHNAAARSLIASGALGVEPVTADNCSGNEASLQPPILRADAADTVKVHRANVNWHASTRHRQPLLFGRERHSANPCGRPHAQLAPTGADLKFPTVGAHLRGVERSVDLAPLCFGEVFQRRR
jgi:hypothetical protein